MAAFAYNETSLSTLSVFKRMVCMKSYTLQMRSLAADDVGTANNCEAILKIMAHREIEG